MVLRKNRISQSNVPKELQTLPRQESAPNTQLIRDNCTLRKMAHAPMRWPTHMFLSRSPPGIHTRKLLNGLVRS